MGQVPEMENLIRQPKSTLKAFTWADVDHLVGLVSRLGRTGLGASTEAIERLRRLYSRPGIHPERDCLLAWGERGLEGYTFLLSEERIGRGILLGGVHPRRRGRGIGKLLIDAITAHARGLDFQMLHVEISPKASAAKRLLKQAGFSRVQTYWHMLRPSANSTGTEAPVGYNLRLLQRTDVPAVTRLQNEAFTGDWGFCPNTEEEVFYGIYRMPIEKPDKVLLLERHGLLAGYCWTHREASDGPGRIHMVGVHPKAQGAGLGKAVTGAGIDHLLAGGALSIELTVNSSNMAALRLYRRLGFRLRKVTYWYELGLR